MPLSHWVRKLFGADEAASRAPARRDAEFVRLRVRRMEERRVFTAVPVVTNLNFSQSYTEDTTLNLTDISVSDDSATITATLTLSDTAAGSLTTGTFGTVTSTYIAGTGTWSASGALADVNAALAAVSFVPTANYNSNFTIAISIKDDNPAVTGTATLTGIAVNDPPTLTTTTSTPTFTEGGSAVSLFSATTISTVETGQTITRLDLTVSNVTNGASEILRVDGTDISLVNGSATTATNGFTYNVSVAGNTATVSLTKAAGISTSLAQTLVNGITYRNSSQDPTAANRTVTLTRIDDDGLGVAPDVNTRTLSAASTVTVAAVNDAPTLSTTTTSSATYTEGDAATSLFTATTISTIESSQTITRLDLTVSNVSNGASEILQIDGTDIALVVGSGTTATNGFAYNVSVAGSTATITLTKVAGVSTTLAQTMVNGITYRNTSQDPTAGSRTVTLTRIDDSGSNSAPSVNTTTLSAASTVAVSGVNDAPTLATTTSTPTFTEGGSVVSLFSATAVSTIEAGQTITRLELTVTDVADGAAEILRIDGTDIALVDGGSGTTATNGFTYGVSVVGATTTIVLTKAAGATTAAMQTLVNAITYRNTSQDPTAGDRVVTLTRIDDNGSNTAPNSNTTTLAADSTVTVAAANDPPTLSATATSPAYTEGGAGVSLFSGTTISTIEAGQTITRLDLTVTNVSAGDILNIDGTDVVLVAGAPGTTATNGLTYTITGTGTVTISLTKVGGVSAAVMQSIVDGLTYRNSGQAPNPGAHVVTLTRIDDSGSNTAPNVNTTTLSLASTVTVTVVNSAPQLTGSNGLPDIDEDIALASNTGRLVSDLISGRIVDVDGPQQGIAVTAAGNLHGTWQYTTDGTNWNAITGLTPAPKALLLLADATTRIRYVPSANYNGTSDPIQFRAWDGFSGTNGTVVSLPTTGGTTAFGNELVTDTLTVTAVNDPPTLTTTTTNAAAYSEGGAAASLFSGTTISTFEAGQTITRLDLTVTNVSGGGDILNFDGTGIALVAGNNGTTATNGFTYSVTVASGTATVTLTNAAGVTTTVMQTLVDGITYSNTSDNPTGGSRVVTLTRIDDNGSNTAPNDNTTTLSAASTVTVTPVNDPPVVTPSATDVAYQKGSTTPIVIDGLVVVADPDNTTLLRIVVQITNKQYQSASRHDDLTMAGFTSSTLNFAVVNDNTTSQITISAKAGQTPTLADYQAALRAVRFVTTSTIGIDRTITVIANDGAAVSNTATYTVVVDQPPQLVAPSSLLSYTEDGASASIALSATAPTGVTITDGDDTAMYGATITLNNASATDVFEFDNLPAKIKGTMTLVGSVLTLTLENVDDLDPAPIADWVTAIQSIKYHTTSDTPITSNRTLSFTVTDGQLNSNTRTRTLDITAANDPPVMTATTGKTSYTEGATGVVIDSGLTLVDPDNANMTGATVTIVGAIAEDQLVFVNQNGISVLSNTGGVLTLIGTASKANYLAALQSVKYHNSNSNNPTVGDRTISFVVNDGSALSTAVTKIVTVVAENDAPVLSGANNLTSIAEDPATNNGQYIGDLISGRITDPDGAGALQGIAVTAVVNTNGVWQYSTDDGQNWTSFGIVSGTAAQLLASDGLTKVRFVPNLNYNGSATGGITFRAWDRTSGTVGVAADTSTNGGTTAFSTASFTSTISVTAVNDAPVIDAGPYTMPTITEDLAPASNTGTTVGTLVPSSHFTDIDGSSVQQGIAVTSVDTTNGDWEYSINGTTWISLNGASDTASVLLAAGSKIRFLPKADFNGTISNAITFRAWDGATGSVGGTADTSEPNNNGGTTAFGDVTRTASITVTAVNDPPVRTSGALTAINADEDSANITAVSVGFSGLTYSNGGGSDENSQTRTYTITGIPSYITLWNGVTQVVAGTPTANLTLTELQGLTYRTLPNVNGSGANITWTVKDSGGGTDTLNESLAVTINAVNDAPLFAVSPPTNFTMPQNLQATLPTFQVSDVDNPISGLTVTATSSNSAIIDNTTTAIEISKAADGTVTLKLTPQNGASGDVTIRVMVSDGIDTTFRDIQVRVNNPPTFTSFPTDQTITEDVEKQVDVTLTVSDAETPAANLVVTATSNNQDIIPNANITVGPASPTNGDRTLHIVPADNWAGDVTITVRVTDGGGVFFERTFVVHITAVNDPPVVAAQSGTTDEDMPLSSSLTAQSGDNERPLQPLRYELVAGPVVGTIVINSNGTFTYTPRANYSGTDQFLFKVTDDGSPTGVEQSTFGLYTVTINPVADVPTIPTDVTITGDENTLFTLGLNIQPSDLDGSEAITRVIIANVHPEFTFYYSDGRVMPPTSTVLGRNSYDMSYGEFLTLRISAPDNFPSGTDIRFYITATSQELGTALTQTKSDFVPVLVRNVAPNISQLFASNVDGNATTNLTSTITDAPRDTFRLEIRWGISKTGFPSTTIVGGLGPSFAQIAQSFQFLVAPDPSDPSAPIQIQLVATDKDGGSSTRTVTIQVPGTGIPTPIVRDLGLIDAPSLLRAYSVTEIPDVRTTIPTAPTAINDRRFIAQRVATSERSFELHVVMNNGEDEVFAHPMPLDTLLRLTEYLGRLPDGRYRVYMRENDFTTPRLLADVVVYKGLAVSPGDLQDDRPPKQTLPGPTRTPNIPPIAKTPGPNETSADVPMEEEAPADGVGGPQLRNPGLGGPGLRGPGLRDGVNPGDGNPGDGVNGPGLPESKPERQDLRGRAP